MPPFQANILSCKIIINALDQGVSLLTLSKLLSSEFIADNSHENVLWKWLWISKNYNKIIYCSVEVLECTPANPLRWLVPTCETVQNLV